MKSDEGFSDMLDKTILIDCLNENVIRFQPKTKFKKRSLYCAFFLSELKIFNEVFNECSMKFPFQITHSKVLDDTMYAKLIYTKI